jgi:hypothetical protein
MTDPAADAFHEWLASPEAPNPGPGEELGEHDLEAAFRAGAEWMAADELEAELPPPPRPRGPKCPRHPQSDQAACPCQSSAELQAAGLLPGPGYMAAITRKYGGLKPN